MEQKNVKTYAEVRFFKWEEADTSVSLRAASGSYGGGSEVLVVTSVEASAQMIIKESTTNMLNRGS